jgi:hypothetical protein
MEILSMVTFSRPTPRGQDVDEFHATERREFATDEPGAAEMRPEPRRRDGAKIGREEEF